MISERDSQRFAGFVEKTDGCWLWTGQNGGRDPRRAYGKFWIQGRRRQATHVAWEIASGKPFPVGALACHTCDTPRCVNPAHIFVGDKALNALDAAAKGRLRSAFGDRTSCARGHPFDEINTAIVVTNGKRYRRCRLCDRDRARLSRRLPCAVDAVDVINDLMGAE